MSWLHEKTTEFLSFIDDIKDKRAFPFFRQFENIGSRVKIGSGSFINFTSNDYLGLSQNRTQIRRSMQGTARYGTGLGSSRLQASCPRHSELERRLARWLGYESCAVFTTGYQSLVGVLSTYLDNETTVVLDNFSHASILDGVFLAKGNSPELEIRFIKHNSVRALRRVLKTAKHSKKLVIVEGLYSVDGDIAPLDEFVQVCKEFDAVIVVDDAHGLGALGRTGRGVGEIYGVLREIDVIVGTFSKSFGGIGGFVCADRPIIDYLKLQARSFVYSASLPVAQVEAALAALDVIEKDHALFRRLEHNAQFFREGLLELGFNLMDSTAHITPIFVGDEEKAAAFGAYLYHGAGLIMLPFVYPGVPKGAARLRCNVTATHTRAEMGYALEALGKVAQMLEILPQGSHTAANDVQRALWFAQHKLNSVRNAGLGYVVNELGQAGQKVSSWGKNLVGRSNGV